MPRGMINAPVFTPPKGMGSPMQMPMMPPMPGGMPPMPASPQAPPQQQPGFSAPAPLQAQAGYPGGQPSFPVAYPGPAQPGFPVSQPPYMNPYATQKAPNNPAWPALATQAIQAAAAQALQQAIESNQVPPEVAQAAEKVQPAASYQAPTPIAGRANNRVFSTLGARNQYSTRA